MKVVYVQGMRSFSETFIRSEKAYIRKRHDLVDFDLRLNGSPNPLLWMGSMLVQALKGKSLAFDRNLLRILRTEWNRRERHKLRILGIWTQMDLWARRIQAVQADRVVIHFLFDTSLAASLLCKGLNIPYVLRLHTRSTSVCNENALWMLQHAERLYAISHQLSAHINRISGRTVHMLPQRVEPIARIQTKPNKGPIRILSAGRWIPKKGFVPMIKSMALLPPTIRWQWVIYGEGPEENAMQQTIEETGLGDRIILSPKISHRILLEQIEGVHMMLVPSIATQDDEDGIPTVIPEAMMRNTLVVSTAVGAISELVQNGETGFLVDMANSRKLAEQMEQILSRRDNWAGMLDKANELARSRYVEQWEFEL